jgi:hypothetical protein
MALLISKLDISRLVLILNDIVRSINLVSRCIDSILFEDFTNDHSP